MKLYRYSISRATFAMSTMRPNSRMRDVSTRGCIKGGGGVIAFKDL